jgi:hypothetical protein
VVKASVDSYFINPFLGASDGLHRPEVIENVEEHFSDQNEAD